MEMIIKPPTHILRNKCIESLIRELPPGRFLEIGAGIGEEAKIFLRRSFYGVCCDISKESREALAVNLKSYQDKIEIVGDYKSILPGSFDYLFIFDVLEHIADDEAALKDWTSFLKTGGVIIISVPAHMKEFGESDSLMGHIRRYEKGALQAVMKRSGYGDIEVLNYGFPLINFTLRVINVIYKLAPKGINEYKNVSLARRTTLSGVKAPNAVSKFSFLFNDLCLFPFILLQKLFFKKDWGVAYVAYGKKS